MKYLFGKPLIYLCVILLLTFALVPFAFGQNGLGTTPTSMQPGSPAGSYQLGGMDNINYLNGNLNFMLPVASVSGRGESAVSAMLKIDRTWSVSVSDSNASTPGTIPNYQHAFEAETFSAVPRYGPGFMQERSVAEQIVFCQQEGPPSYTYLKTLNRLLFTDASGTQYELRDQLYDGKPYSFSPGDACGPNVNGISRGKVFSSKDGSNVTFVSDADIKENAMLSLFNAMTGYLLMRDGTKYRIEDGLIKWIKDRNGNQTTYTYEVTAEGKNEVKTITDSLNRVITFYYNVDDGAPYGICDRIVRKGTDGQERVTRISRRPLGEALRSDVSAQNPSWFGSTGYTFLTFLKVPSAFWLPDGRSYQFRYNLYAELARVELPTGGRFDYEHVAQTGLESTDGYVGAGGPSGMIYRRVATKKTYRENGTLENTLVVENPQLPSGPQLPSELPITVTTVAPDNTLLSKVKHYYYTLGESDFYFEPTKYNNWLNGREFKTETFAADGQTVLNRTETTWQQRAPVAWHNPSYGTEPANDPRKTEVRTTLETNQVTTKTFDYDQFNNETDTYEYDFGEGTPGAFLRRSHTDYITDPNYTSHTGAHLKSLPIQTWISSDAGGSNKVSLSQIEYDNYANDTTHASLLGRSNVSGHDSATYSTGNPWRGNVTQMTSFGSAAAQSDAVSGYSQYDILGNVVKTIDARGNISTISYNDNFGVPNSEARTNSSAPELGGQQTFAFPTSGTNPTGWTSYAQFDYYTSRSVDTEDIYGNVSSFFYNDLLDRPTQTITANNTPQRQQSSIVYDDANRRIFATRDLYAFGDNLSKGESFYDGLGRIVQSRKYEENGGYIVNLTEYDALGRVKRASNPFRPAQSEPQLWTTSQYDALSRPVAITSPDGATATTAYSGNIVVVTDQAGKYRRRLTNGIGQIIRVDEPDTTGNLGSISSPTQVTTYTYDTLGNLVQVMQGGQTRTFQYDSLSRLRQATNPESGTISYNYDASSNLVQKTDARSVQTNYVYDAINRITQRGYANLPSTVAATPTVNYTYDDPNVAFSKGKLTKVSSAISETRYTQFDNLGRVLSSQQVTDGQTYNFGYQYNLSGMLVQQTYPSGSTVTNQFETDGDLAQVSGAFGGSIKAYAGNINYTAAGAVSAMQLGNSRWETTQFNSRLQPTQIGLGTSINDQSLLKLNFGYETGNTGNNGNMTSQQITIGGQLLATQSYTYDSLNRLKSAEENSGQSWKQVFNYDRYGNRKFDQSQTTTLGGCPQNVCNPDIDQVNNRLVGYQYDAAGNTQQDAEQRKFVYDAENKQVQVKNVQNMEIGTYFYDGDGKRVKKVAAQETTLFAYDASGKLAAEYTVSSTQSQPPQTSYLTNDHLGSPRITTKQDGTVHSRRDFMPFGEEITGLGNRSAAMGYQSDTIRQKFTGYERDKESDFDFAEARYHNYNLGRFSSPDSLMSSAKIRNPQTFNRYSYTISNPLNLIDPSGLSPRCPPGQTCQNDDDGNEYYIENGNKIYVGGEAVTVTVKAEDTPVTIGYVAPVATKVVEKVPWWKQILRPIGNGAKTVGGAVARVGGAALFILTNPTSTGCGASPGMVSDGNGGCIYDPDKDITKPKIDTTANPNPDDDKPNCDDLPSDYGFSSPNDALKSLKEEEDNNNLKLHNKSPTTSGPCPGVGTHYNVRDGKRRVGSIVCCPCVSGGKVTQRCAIR